MSRIAIFFPGIGYTCERPLLYYARKLAEQSGYECRTVPYAYEGDMKIRGDVQKMKGAFEALYAQAKEILAGEDFEKYDEVLFVSKSVGTVIAAAYARELIGCTGVSGRSADAEGEATGAGQSTDAEGEVARAGRSADAEGEAAEVGRSAGTEGEAAEAGQSANAEGKTVGTEAGMGNTGAETTTGTGKALRDRLRHVFYTPLEYTFSYYPENAVGFLGTADPWCVPDEVIRIARNQRVPMHVYERANHSLETGAVSADLDILKDVMTKTKGFLYEE